MRALLICFALIAIGGCSQVQSGERILFDSETIKVADDSGVITATYTYPACIVQSEERKQIVATFDGGSNSNKATGVISIIGAIIAVIAKALLE